MLRSHYRKAGLTDSLLPVPLRDTEIARSRKGKLGAIKVREYSGVVTNGASRLVRKFESDLTTGRDDILEKLEANTENPQSIVRLIEIMKERPKVSFARAIAEAKADAAVALDAYAKGAIALQKVETLINLYKEMPALFRDLMRHAIDREETCEICLGVGQVQPRAGANKLSKPCPRCSGSGRVVTSSKHKEFAMQKALEMSQLLPEKKPLVQVSQQQMNMTVSAEGGLLEKMSKVADEILYNNRSGATRASGGSPVIDVEAVEVDNG
jgi:hypothetical protein